MARDMTMPAAGTETGANAVEPRVREITPLDLKHALAHGVRDFQEKPSHIIFLIVIYPVVGLFLARLTFGYDVLPLLFPLVAGFAILGPVTAVGLYEISRRLEEGQEVTWRDAFTVLERPSIRSIAQLGAVLAMLFVAWLATAMAIYEITLGAAPESVGEFVRLLFTTGRGWALIVLGNGVGFLFALAALTISVVSFPLLVDRNVSAVTAVRTSVRAVLKNPVSMALWGLIVGVSLLLGSIPFFVGLAVVLPILGHATWHLYRKVVER